MSVGVPTSSVFCEFWDPTTIYPRFSTVCSLSCPTLIISFLLQLSATSDVVLMVYLYFHPQVLMWFYCGCSCKAPACKFPWEDFLFQALLHYFHAICYVIPEHLPLKCTVTRDCGFDKVGHLCLDQSRKSRLKQVMGISRGIVNGLMTTNILQSPYSIQ